MRARILIYALPAIIVVISYIAEAQQPKKIARIGYLAGTAAESDLPRFEAFRLGLRALGYVEGRNIAIESRYTEGKFDQLPELAAELVHLKVEILVAVTTNASLAAKNATRTIPIFLFGVTDPVAAGLVDTWRAPGGNLRG